MKEFVSEPTTLVLNDEPAYSAIPYHTPWTASPEAH